MAPEYPESGRSTHGEPAKVAAANMPERTASYAHSSFWSREAPHRTVLPPDGHPAGRDLRSGSSIEPATAILAIDPGHDPELAAAAWCLGFSGPLSPNPTFTLFGRVARRAR